MGLDAEYPVEKWTIGYGARPERESSEFHIRPEQWCNGVPTGVVQIPGQRTQLGDTVDGDNTSTVAFNQSSHFVETEQGDFGPPTSYQH